MGFYLGVGGSISGWEVLSRGGRFYLGVGGSISGSGSGGGAGGGVEGYHALGGDREGGGAVVGDLDRLARARAVLGGRPGGDVAIRPWQEPGVEGARRRLPVPARREPATLPAPDRHDPAVDLAARVLARRADGRAPPDDPRDAGPRVLAHPGTVVVLDIGTRLSGALGVEHPALVILRRPEVAVREGVARVHDGSPVVAREHERCRERVVPPVAVAEGLVAALGVVVVHEDPRALARQVRRRPLRRAEREGEPQRTAL